MRVRCSLSLIALPLLAACAHVDGARPSNKSAAPATPIVYFDIAGPDLEKLADFYARAFEWKIDLNNNISPLSTGVAGSFRKDPPDKILYIGVPDVTQALQSVMTAGGTVIAPRFEVKGVVILGLFKDPAGNTMGVVETINGKIKIP